MKTAVRVLMIAAVLLLVQSFARPTAGGAAAALLVAGVLTLAASVSSASGAELVLALAVFYFVPGSLINIPEGVLFDVIKVTEAPLLLAREVAIALVAGVTVAAVMGRLRPGAGRPALPPPFAGVSALLARLGGAVAVFVCAYFVAGMIIFPFVKEYYAGRAMPGPAAIVAMQLLRSLALVAAAYPLLRTIASRRAARLTLAVALPVIGGIAQLLQPTELMPAAVRLVHGLEIAPYYALYGFLLAVWFGPGEPSPPLAVPATAPAFGSPA